MAELAAEAGVSTSLIYYHFTDRAGILRETLEFISERADRYTAQWDPGEAADNPLTELAQVLLLELQDTVEVRENSTAWGELRASAVFDADLRVDLAKATHTWVHEIAELLGRAQPTGTAPAHAASAERLTALLEGLSVRWLSGSLPREHARRLLGGAIAAELGGRHPELQPAGITVD